MSEKFNKILKYWNKSQKRPFADKTVKKISFSQFSNWTTCPHLHYLISIAKKLGYRDTDYTAFGYPMHEALQLMMLSKQLDEEMSPEEIYNFFIKRYEANIQKIVANDNINKTELSHDKVIEFATAAKAYLPKIYGFMTDTFGNYQVIETERSIKQFLDHSTENYQYQFRGEIDLVLENNKTHIIDWKTSNRGWSDWKKEQEVIGDQIRFYAHFYSKATNIPLEDIEAHYIILNTQTEEIEKFTPELTQEKVDGMFQRLHSMLFNAFEREYYPKGSCGLYCECKKYYDSLTE